MVRRWYEHASKKGRMVRIPDCKTELVFSTVFSSMAWFIFNQKHFMARQRGTRITGTFGNVTFYKMRGEYFMRKKSSLTRKRVKRSKAFRKTMMYAGWMARAARVASKVYRIIPRAFHRIALYRTITGEAMHLLKAGTEDKEAINILKEKYINPDTWINKESKIGN